MVLKKKNKKYFAIIALLIMLLFTFFLKKELPSKVANVIEKLDKASPPLNSDKTTQPLSENLKMPPALLSLCSTQEMDRYSKKEVIQMVFNKDKYQHKVIWTNDFFEPEDKSKNTNKNKIVRWSGRELTIFEEDIDGFPRPVELTSEVLSDPRNNWKLMVKGLELKEHQIFEEYISASASLLINTSNGAVSEIEITNTNGNIKCRGNRCRCY